jgi:gamma-glutamylcyclotransferase (GGCT)/AIG2-like uncharacterized protein YtfP
LDAEPLFVYGTLLPGLEPAHLIPFVTQLGKGAQATISGMLFDLGPYPGVVVDPSALIEPASASPRSRRFESAWREARCVLPNAAEETRVRGLVFDLPLDPTILRAFDHYEGYDAGRESGEFERVLGYVTLTDNRTVSAWIYGITAIPASARLIPGGDYLHR